MNEEMSEFISIEKIFYIIKKNLIIIILIPLLTTSISFIYSFYITKPLYETSTKVFIGKENNQNEGGTTEKYSDSDVEMYQKLLKTYSELIKTNTLIKKALNENNINLQSSAVLGNLTVNPMTNTQILELKYQNSNKLLSGSVINAITNQFIKEAQTLIPDGNVKVIDDVVIPENPTKPNKKLNLAIGFILGCMISLGIIFLLEFLDNTFKTKEKIEKVIELPALGIIPDDTKIPKSKKHTPLIVEQKPESTVAEAYKTLLTNIYYSSSQKPIRKLLVTSSNIQEGKSTIVANLALSFAEIRKLVITVDCDFRKPALHKKFNLPNTCGLSEVLIGKESLENAIQKYNDYVHVLPSGLFTRKPTSILASKKLDNILEALEQQYDLIILDSAPAQAVSDAQILSTKADGTLIIVHAGKTKAKSVLETKNLLSKVNGVISGIVLNRAENPNINYYYNNHSNSHSHHSHSHKKQFLEI